MENKNQFDDIRFLIEPNLKEKFTTKLKESGYATQSEFLREKIREFVGGQDAS